MDYIKRGIEDIRVEQKAQGRRYDELAERVTRVEESAKQAHRRIDRLDNEGRG
jgi:phage shock protein A